CCGNIRCWLSFANSSNARAQSPRECPAAARPSLPLPRVKNTLEPLNNASAINLALAGLRSCPHRGPLPGGNDYVVTFSFSQEQMPAKQKVAHRDGSLCVGLTEVVDID